LDDRGFPLVGRLRSEGEFIVKAHNGGHPLGLEICPRIIEHLPLERRKTGGYRHSTEPREHIIQSLRVPQIKLRFDLECQSDG
jgi:hypothetical protein